MRIKNGLVVGVILLFIGIAVQPVIIADVSFESDNSELVEITVEICNVNGAQENTIMLTPEQAEELENLINNFEIELDGADSIAETEIIFKNMVISLNELGLLPEGMSVEEAQRLVTGKEQDPRIIRSLERWISKYQGTLDDNENTFCLIAGRTSYTTFQGLIGRLAVGTLVLFAYFFPELFYLTVGEILLFLAIMSIIWNINPLSLGYEISLGISHSHPYYGEISEPAKGRINTIGTGGNKRYRGSLYGDLPLFNFILVLATCYPGVFGFTGIKIFEFYMGFALWVKIKEV